MFKNGTWKEENELRQQSRLKTATCSAVQHESHLTARWNLEGNSNQHTVHGGGT